MTDDEFKAVLANQGPELETRLRHMIDHLAKRIEYAEGRRNFFLTASGGFSGRLNLGGHSQLPFLLASTRIRVLGAGRRPHRICSRRVESALEPRKLPYPFTQVANVPKWFYRYAILDWAKYTFPWIRKLDKTEIARDRKKFEDDYSTFLDTSTNTLIDPVQSRLQDVKQIYLLHVNEMYKNRFLTSLRKTFDRGLMVVLTAAILAFVVGVIINQQRWPAEELRGQSGMKIRSVWEPTSLTASSTINLNVVVTNSTDVRLNITALQLRNHRGILLPYNVIQGKLDFPIQIEAGAETRLALTLELRVNSITAIESVVVVRSP